jgi:hypothetical protein
MIRIAVISLVVANLFLLGFQASKPAPEPVKAAAPKRVSGDPRIPTIHLFSEMVADEELLSGNRRCFTLGPFYVAEDREQVRTSLLRVSAAVVERETEALVEKGYWVFMPPYVSLLEANRELLSLKALGLTDVGIIYDGEWQNAISLGYFLRQENAQRRKKDLEKRGFEPRMIVRRQSEPRFWLDYEQPPGSELPAIDMRDRPNDFQQRPMPCPEEPAQSLVTSPPLVDPNTLVGGESVTVVGETEPAQRQETENQVDVQEAATESSTSPQEANDPATTAVDTGEAPAGDDAETPNTEDIGQAAPTGEQTSEPETDDGNGQDETR